MEYLTLNLITLTLKSTLEKFNFFFYNYLTGYGGCIFQRDVSWIISLFIFLLFIFGSLICNVLCYIDLVI